MYEDRNTTSLGTARVHQQHRDPTVMSIDEEIIDEEFDFSMCEIPGPHKWDFSIDEKGVYQVYNGEGACMSLWLCVICGVDLRQIATTMRFLA